MVFGTVRGPTCAQVEGGQCKTLSRQTTHCAGHRGKVTASNSLRQLNMGWRGEVPLLSLTVAHVPPDFIQMPHVLGAAETAVALVETGKLFLRCRSVKPLSY